MDSLSIQELFKIYTMGLGKRWVCDGLITNVYMGEEWQWELDNVEVMVQEMWDHSRHYFGYSQWDLPTPLEAFKEEQG